MRCEACGAELPDGATTCPSCGAPVPAGRRGNGRRRSVSGVPDPAKTGDAGTARKPARAHNVHDFLEDQVEGQNSVGQTRAKSRPSAPRALEDDPITGDESTGTEGVGVAPARGSEKV